MGSETPPMTLTAYAERRGVSKMAVSRACKVGILAECVVRGPTGKVIGISDPELADREWAANSDYSIATQHAPKAPLAPREDDGDPTAYDGTVSGAAARQKYWQAKLAELKFRQESAELVPAKDVSARLVAVFTQCKTRLLGIPSRARQALPHLTVADVAALENLVREALEDLAAEGSK